MLVLALVAALTSASSAQAFTAKTALRGQCEISRHRVAGLGVQAREAHRKSTREYGDHASDSTHASRAIPNAIRYTAMDAGPLPAAIANTFRGGSYTATTVSEATTLYRVYGGTAGEVGSFWTRTAPSGPLQSTIDLALNPAWGNTAANVARIQVPAGTVIYEGAAAAQGGLVGGGSQVFIPTVQASWLVP
jgi:hypothetical protein